MDTSILNIDGLSTNKVISDEVVTPSLRLGEGKLASDELGNLTWNGEQIETPDTSNFVTKDNIGFSHFVGEQWISFDGTIPAGGLPFDGRSVEKTLYPDLVKWIQDNNRAITMEEYQSMLSSNNANVPYYVIGDTNIILPIFRGYLYFNDNKAAGTYIKEGLPNITGNLHPLTSDNEAYFHTRSTISGAFYKISTGSENTTVQNTGGTYAGFALGFDASKSNSIYGRSSNVTPHTTCILIGVYAHNTISNQSNIDLETFRQTMENGLADGMIPLHETTTEILPFSDKLCVINATPDFAPNNGVILSQFTSANWGSQLYIGDNSKAGLSFRGLYDGVMSDWQPIPHIIAKWQSGANWYRKYSDGWIEQGGTTASQVYSSAKTITLNTSFTNTNYTINITGKDSWYGATVLGTKSKTSFTIINNHATAITAQWYACGY